MASTNQEPDAISITVTDSDWGTVTWIPGPGAQERLQAVSEADMPQVTKAIKASLKIRLKGVNDVVCDAVGHKAKKRAEALADLKLSKALHTGTLSGGPNPDGPFAHGRIL